jgi:hypothetical protein
MSPKSRLGLTLKHLISEGFLTSEGTIGERAKHLLESPSSSPSSSEQLKLALEESNDQS